MEWDLGCLTGDAGSELGAGLGRLCMERRHPALGSVGTGGDSWEQRCGGEGWGEAEIQCGECNWGLNCGLGTGCRKQT